MSLNPDVSERMPILVAKSFVLSLASSSKTASKSEAPKPKAGSTKSAFKSADQEDTVDSKEHLSVVFVGYINAVVRWGKNGKNTKESERESWYLSWALGERVKSKTVETGKAYFETNKRHYVILDLPDHKDFVANFERGGQTRKHMMLGKVFGINKLIVTVNKMDGLLSHCTMG
ncbi:hypothetical protein G6F57_009513 [Rhizopus arrhizus]|nr:hypothetical protein G6F24_009435 [Rhizopus arrhizus]KAG0783188.1 hypothetical protein G6F21_010676 [Rhizopus arrhizus]KAG0794036.1 hypothetical protein G6F22_005455 [Rhizopus arrhizus]KAG0808395.1 hypothetical protein G6F20_009614 [Rhizopus arrhizus]KAG0824929.1 hypothetical protein G6F19_010073 [Rhizopus arrhizus]